MKEARYVLPLAMAVLLGLSSDTNASAHGFSSPSSASSHAEFFQKPFVPIENPYVYFQPEMIPNMAAIVKRHKFIYSSTPTNRVMVVGDSHTRNSQFLAPLGCGTLYYPGTLPQDYADTIAYFSSSEIPGSTVKLCRSQNTLNRAGYSSTEGWSAKTSLKDEGNFSYPLFNEIATTQPTVAFILFGSNDVRNGVSVADYQSYIQQIISICSQNGAISVLLTVPPRPEGHWLNPGINQYNTALRSIARETKTPLIDLNAYLVTQKGYLLGRDGLHLLKPAFVYFDWVALDVLHAIRLNVLQP